jgi:hypothetical protein
MNRKKVRAFTHYRRTLKGACFFLWRAFVESRSKRHRRPAGEARTWTRFDESQRRRDAIVSRSLSASASASAGPGGSVAHGDDHDDGHDGNDDDGLPLPLYRSRPFTLDSLPKPVRQAWDDALRAVDNDPMAGTHRGGGGGGGGGDAGLGLDGLMTPQYSSREEHVVSSRDTMRSGMSVPLTVGQLQQHRTQGMDDSGGSGGMDMHARDVTSVFSLHRTGTSGQVEQRGDVGERHASDRERALHRQLLSTTTTTTTTVKKGHSDAAAPPASPDATIREISAALVGVHPVHPATLSPGWLTKVARDVNVPLDGSRARATRSRSRQGRSARTSIGEVQDEGGDGSSEDRGGDVDGATTRADRTIARADRAITRADRSVARSAAGAGSGGGDDDSVHWDLRDDGTFRSQYLERRVALLQGIMHAGADNRFVHEAAFQDFRTITRALSHWQMCVQNTISVSRRGCAVAMTAGIPHRAAASLSGSLSRRHLCC